MTLSRASLLCGKKEKRFPFVVRSKDRIASKGYPCRWTDSVRSSLISLASSLWLAWPVRHTWMSSVKGCELWLGSRPPTSTSRLSQQRRQQTRSFSACVTALFRRARSGNGRRYCSVMSPPANSTCARRAWSCLSRWPRFLLLPHASRTEQRNAKSPVLSLPSPRPIRRTSWPVPTTQLYWRHSPRQALATTTRNSRPRPSRPCVVLGPSRHHDRNAKAPATHRFGVWRTPSRELDGYLWLVRQARSSLFHLTSHNNTRESATPHDHDHNHNTYFRRTRELP
mmetsp:Transcript_9697/g.10974  ORF Transcript_9697/g.10974 Transcript_9697/m.10974 type:complete len:282 (-) Transcript_9697:14-859(-)